jgi:hypothetical protein
MEDRAGHGVADTEGTQRTQRRSNPRIIVPPPNGRVFGLLVGFVGCQFFSILTRKAGLAGDLPEPQEGHISVGMTEGTAYLGLSCAH